MESVNKVCRILTAMAGHEINGVTNGDLAAHLNASPATITAYIKALISEGYVEEIPGLKKRWRLTPRFIQIALTHQRAMTTEEQRFNEVKQRYSRER